MCTRPLNLVQLNNLFITSASQTWCLGRHLPLPTGDEVLEDDEKWLNFLFIMDMVDCVLAPVCSVSVVASLRHMICVHHLEFKRLYLHKTITLKMHFLIHYPEVIARYMYIKILSRALQSSLHVLVQIHLSGSKILSFGYIQVRTTQLCGVHEV